MKVTLHIYDLSQGMAKIMSPMIMGQTIDAVYHTGVVVADTEYYYGAGIQSEAVGQTPFGSPMQQMDMGETSKTQTEIREFLHSIQSRYTESTYNLVEHNCNHFSNEFLLFLCDKKVPDYILSQAASFLETPFGRMLAPMLQSNAFGIPGASVSGSIPAHVSSGTTQKKSSLTIEKPLFFVAKEPDFLAIQDCIIAKYGEKGMLNEGTTFQAEFSRLTRAVFDKTLCDISSEVVASICGLLAEELTVSAAQNERFISSAFDCLACICLSTDQSSITDSCLPLRLLEVYDTLPGGALEPLYRYIHNWLTQLRGMHDFRDHADRYLEFLTGKILNSTEPLQRLYGYRILYTSSRIFTRSMAIDAQSSLCPLLIETIINAAEKAKVDGPDRKSNVQIANLASGILGRLILTSDDKESSNGWYVTAQKALSDKGLLSLGAPCCTDLHNHLQADECEAELF